MLFGVLCMFDEFGEVFVELCCCVILLNGIIQVVIELFQVDGFEVIVGWVIEVVICCGQVLLVVND